MDCNKVGSFIANLRKEKGYTQESLGRSLGVTSKAVSKWECGVSLPDISLLNKMSDLLEVSVEDILNGGIVVKEEAPESKIKLTKRAEIIVYFLIEIILIISLFLVTYLFSNGDYRTYEINSDYDGIMLTGIFTYNSEKYMLIIDNLRLSKGFDEEETQIYDHSFQLYLNDINLLSVGDASLYERDKYSTGYSYKEMFNKIIIYLNDNYEYVEEEELRGKNKKMVLVINYITKDDNLKTIKIPLSLN